MVSLRQLSKKELVGLLVKLGYVEVILHTRNPSKEWLLNEVKKNIREKQLSSVDISEMLSDLPKLELYK